MCRKNVPGWGPRQSRPFSKGVMCFGTVYVRILSAHNVETVHSLPSSARLHVNKERSVNLIYKINAFKARLTGSFSSSHVQGTQNDFGAIFCLFV